MNDKEKSKHPSNSDTQKNIEGIVIELLSHEFKKEFKNSNIEHEEAKFKLDLYFESNDEIIIGEVYAGIDELKPGQRKKIGSDFLKLITIEEILKRKNLNCTLKKIFIVVDEKINDAIKNSWLAQSAKIFEIEIRKINLSQEEKKELQQAKEMQGENFKNK